jgi:hypothetical protein
MGLYAEIVSNRRDKIITLQSIEPTLSLSLSLWLYNLLLDLDFFSFLILYAVGRTPWRGDQPVARPLPTQDDTNTE